jgi:hypothetical protein
MNRTLARRFALGAVSALTLCVGTVCPTQTIAQVTNKVVSTCGQQSYAAGSSQYPTMDTTGDACTNGGSGGGAGSTWTSAQVSVGATAMSIVGARTGRLLIVVVNTSTTAVYLGPTSGVTTSTGTFLPGVVGASITLPYTGALYGITASGSATVSETELY